MTIKARLDWVDLSKGIGIILVVYGHVARGLDSAGLRFDLFGKIDDIIYAFHMPLFFVLAGYFFLKSAERGLAQFAQVKISTILYPYLVWSLFQIIIQFMASRYTNGTVQLLDVITFFVPRGQFWFLFALFNILMINVLLFKGFGRIGFVLSSLISIVYIFHNPHINILDDTLNNILFFNLGIYMSSIQKIKSLVLDRKVVMYINFVLFLLMELLLFTHEFKSSLFSVIIGVSGSLFVIQFFYTSKIKCKHLKEIGSQSMIIYLMHIIIASGSRIVLMKFFKLDNVLINCLIITILGIYVPFILYKVGVLEKVNFLFNLSYLLPKPQSPS